MSQVLGSENHLDEKQGLQEETANSAGHAKANNLEKAEEELRSRCRQPKIMRT